MQGVLVRRFVWLSLLMITVLSVAAWTVVVTNRAHAQELRPSFAFVSPKDGAVITANAVPVILSMQNWTLDCRFAGTPNKEGVGHWHLLLDGGLINMICDPFYTLTLQNVKPGRHTLTAVPAENDHAELEKSATKVTFAYQPSTPLPPIVGVNLGKPSITILYPKNGGTVSGQAFPLIFAVRNYRLSCDLLGRPQVAGTGHWHVNVDRTRGPMMGMATMLNMGCSNSLEISLAGIKPGKHRFIAILTDNLHAPIKPAVEAAVTVTVKK